MDILLNLAPLVPPRTGVGRYTCEILRGAARAGQVDQIQAFIQNRWVDPREFMDPDEGAPGLSEGRRRLYRVKDLLKKIPYATELRMGLGDYVFSRQARKFGACLYHETNYVCRPFPGPKVLTVHDLSHIHYPQYHPRDRVAWLSRGLPQSLRKARRIITVSGFVKQELVELLGVDPAKVQDIPLGVNAQYRPRSREEVLPVLQRNSIQDAAYILVVGTLEPRKNLKALLQAYTRLPQALRRRHPLVLVGAGGWRQSHFQKEMAALVSRGEARPLGYVPETDLPAIYAGAFGLAFPSVYEGFGLPPLEAMACGIPVLASRAAAIPEVVGEAALPAEPRDVDSLCSGLHRLLTDADFRERAVSRGPEQAAKFTWERCVRETLGVYARALEA